MSQIDDLTGLRPEQFSSLNFGIGSRPPRDATFSATLTGENTHQKWEGLVRNALRFTSGVPFCGKHSHMKSGMKEAIESQEFFRTLKANELWPQLADCDALVLSRPNQAALIYRDQWIQLERIAKPCIPKEDSWRYLWSSSHWMEQHIKRHWRPYASERLDPWCQSSWKERFWNNIEISGATQSEFRAVLQAIRVLFSRFCAPEFASSEKWPDQFYGYAGESAMLVFTGEQPQSRVSYRAHDCFYQQAETSLRVRAVLRLWALFWSAYKMSMSRTPWLGATVNGLNIAGDDALLKVAPLAHRATAHEAIEAIQTLRALLAQVPAAQQHIQTLNRSDDQSDQTPPVAYYTRGPMRVAVQTVMDPRGSCDYCTHYRSDRWVCAAFPQGIPNVIYRYGQSVHHDKPFDGDGGVLFDASDPEAWESNVCNPATRRK